MGSASRYTSTRTAPTPPDSAHKEHLMAADATAKNQKAILANQGKIMGNQKKIVANQAKILANQKAILKKLG